MTIDLGKFGNRISYCRFTMHPPEEVKDRLVFGLLNFEPRQMGPVAIEVLILGVQYSKADSGEATLVSPAVNLKNRQQAILGFPKVDCLQLKSGRLVSFYKIFRV